MTTPPQAEHPAGRAGSPIPASVRARLKTFPDYSWRRDQSVPAFPDHGVLIVFDGVCVMCSNFARFVAVRDRRGTIEFIAAQSRLGQALMRHYNLDPADFETNLLIADGRVFGKLDSMAGALQRLAWPWPAVANLVRLIPAAIGDWLYDRIARSRYALFGRRQVCIIPGPEWRDRLLDLDKD